MIRLTSLLIFLVLCVSAGAQSPFAGDWSGKLNVGVSLRIVFHVKDSLGLHVVMDSPDQGAFGLKSTGLTTRGDSILIMFNRIGGRYIGALQHESGKATLNGIWHQGGAKFPLVLEKGEAPALVRPQMPKPPFDYVIEDVVYTNPDKSVTLGATLTRPTGTGKYPAVILISGSGQQDRDETIMGHKPFWVLADHLTKNGFAVLRVDDRGTGKSTGEVVNATSEDFANDVITSITYLKTRSDINLKKIGLIGHSEGGIIAPMVAAKTKDVAFMVFLAGPSVKGSEVIDVQRVEMLKAAGAAESVVRETDGLFREITQIIIQSPTQDEAQAKSEEAAKRWLPNASHDTKTVLGIATDDKVNEFVTQTVTRMYSPWFRYFLQFDPAPVLAKTKIPVLALYGEKDIQVLPGQNIEPMKRALAKSRKSSDYQVVEIKGVNHLFQTCTTCTVMEYGDISETLSEETLRTVTDWLKTMR